MDEQVFALKGKNRDELEKKLQFTHYLETKDFEWLRRIKVDHNELVNAFLKFNNGNTLEIVRLYNGVIEEFFTLSLNEVEKGLMLLKNNEGRFRTDDDDDYATSFGLFTVDYMAEFMQEIIFFSGKEEYVEKFSLILKEFKIRHHAPAIIPFLLKDAAAIVTRKLGRNDKCHCGSEMKYKKCCMNKDMKETGKVKKVTERW